MRVVAMVVPEEIFDAYYKVFDKATYCPNTETMCLPIEFFSELMSNPLTIELVNEDIDLEINVCDDE